MHHGDIAGRAASTPDTTQFWPRTWTRAFSFGGATIAEASEVRVVPDMRTSSTITIGETAVPTGVPHIDERYVR